MELKKNVNPNLITETLGSLFQKVTLIANLYNVEKIRTSGEEFIGACGLSGNKDVNPDTKACEFALSLIDAINSYNNDKEISKDLEALLPVKIKVGIHTGNVLSTVMESSVVSFDILGVHVKQASHLERNCPINSIHVSEKTFNEVKNVFEFKDHEFFLNSNLKIKSHLLIKKVDLII